MDIPRYDWSDFDHIPRIPAPVMQPVSFDSNMVTPDLPPRFVELMTQRPRWQQHWQCDPTIEFPSGKNSPSEHIAALMVFTGEMGFTDAEGATIISCFYQRERMKPLHSAKLELTLRFMARGRERMTGNPGPVMTEGQAVPPGTSVTHNEQDTANEVVTPPPVVDIPQNEQDTPSTPFDVLCDVFFGWLRMVDAHLLHVMLACVVANRFDGDPLWLLIVAAPASLKTEIIRALGKLDETHLLSTLTANTFLSGKQTKKGVDFSLLPKLQNKVLLLKDFTTILTMHRDARSEILAQLREIYDGQYSKAFGTGEEKCWEGQLGFLAGVTEMIYQQTAVHSVLGERFLYYKPVPDDRFQVGLQACANTGAERRMREELSNAVKAFMQTVTMCDVTLPPSERDKIVYLADVVGWGRVGVPRDGYNKSILCVPSPETPARLSKQFTLFAKSLALVRQRTEIGDPELTVLRKVAIDSMIDLRAKVFRFLYPESHELTTACIARAISLPTATVLSMLEDCMVLGIIHRDRDADIDGESDRKTPYRWQMSASFKALLFKSEVFTDDVPF